MKKVLSIVLALVFALSMSTIAFADETPDLAGVSSTIENIVDSTGLNAGTDIFSAITNAAAQTLEAISKFDITAVNDNAIAGVIDDFRGALENVGISTSSGTIAQLFSNLKQKIKDLYMPAAATVEPEECAPATGSSATAAIAAFASISVAAAAAFVCTKKKEVA
ncbi:MAG: hypothetical protein IJM10_05835 [Clostridia bacterium]|nr:hypothetical protein [Clostridia bacterium]